MKHKVILFCMSFVFITACGPTTPSVDEQINVAVQQTVESIPTFTPYPPPVILPTSTPLNLAGIFCEYQFCIGHPVDIAFFDVSAQHNPTAPSTISQGLLAAYNANLFIQLIWQNAPGSTDPQFMLDLIIDPKVDTRNGNLEPLLLGDLNVLFVPIATTATPVLPSGGAASWICDGRAFAWKVYAPQPDTPKNLLIESLQSFRCSK